MSEAAHLYVFAWCDLCDTGPDMLVPLLLLYVISGAARVVVRNYGQELGGALVLSVLAGAYPS